MDQDYSDVLSFCNDVRHQVGRKPIPSLRKGQPLHYANCVVAGTINHGGRSKTVSVSYQDIRLGVDHPVCDVPQFILSFMEAFDTRTLPHLVGSGWVA